MKLIFIDIDGVLNNISDGTAYFNYDPASYGLSKTNMSMLRKILKATDAKLVLSTSWRKHPYDYSYMYDGKYYRSPLKKFITSIGRKNFYLIDRCPHLKGCCKYLDILGFFYISGLDPATTKFAVLDDQVNQQLDKFGESFFKIDASTGLTAGVAESIILHLNIEEH